MKHTLITLTAIWAAWTSPLMAADPSSEAALQFANEASTEQLQEVKGIGPALAGRIIAARPYKKGESIEKVKGIGPVVAKRIEDHAKNVRN